jgi:glycine/D-amino acid oxidase-like deaminating enzyme
MGGVDTTEVTVIGGGILGLSTAYHLATAGWHVTLVEMGKIAAGASGANAGYIRRGDPVDSTDAHLYAGSYALYCDWQEHGTLGCDIELQEASVLRCLTDEHVERMEAGLWKSRRLVWAREGLHPTPRGEWRLPEPHVADAITWGIETTSAMINIFRVCQGLAWAATQHGASIRSYTQVHDIEVKKGRVATVVTDRGAIETEYVVNAAGAWAPRIGRMVGIEIPVLPARGIALVTEPTPPITTHRRVLYEPLWFNPDQPYVEESPDPCQRLGVTTELDRHLKEENYVIARSEHLIPLPPRGAKTPTDPETLTHIAASAIRLVPKLEDVHIIRAYAGLRPVCEVDGKPILGPVAGVDGFILAAGPWHTGMSYGPMCGHLVAEIIDGKPPSISIDDLAFARFVNHQHFPYVHHVRWT